MLQMLNFKRAVELCTSRVTNTYTIHMCTYTYTYHIRINAKRVTRQQLLQCSSLHFATCVWRPAPVLTATWSVRVTFGGCHHFYTAAAFRSTFSIFHFPLFTLTRAHGWRRRSHIWIMPVKWQCHCWAFISVWLRSEHTPHPLGTPTTSWLWLTIRFYIEFMPRLKLLRNLLLWLCLSRSRSLFPSLSLALYDFVLLHVSVIKCAD